MNLAGRGTAVTVTLDTRKPAYQLELSDFAAYPVWESALDEEGVEGRDESWVRPVDTRAVPRESNTLVSATFQDRRGRVFAGYVDVWTWHVEFRIWSGAIIENGRCLFFSESPPCYQMTKDALMEGLGLTESELSPLAFTLKVPVEGKLWFGDGELRFRPHPIVRDKQLELW